MAFPCRGGGARPRFVRTVHLQVDNLNTESGGTDDRSVRREEFVRLLQQSYQAIYGAVLVLVPNRVDADDAMQETCVTLWREFDKFELGTNFRRWACSVAYNVARGYVRRENRHRNALNLPGPALARLSQVRDATNELLELRRERLHHCLSRLSQDERLFLRQCYGEGRSLVEAARQLGVTEDAAYARVSRIRKRLYQCINSFMRQGARE